MDRTFNVATEFSRAPSGLVANDGAHNATALRTEIVRLLGEFDHLTVDLSGLAPVAPSYIREAFGGLVEKEHFTGADLAERLKIVCADDLSIALQARQEIEIAAKSAVAA